MVAEIEQYSVENNLWQVFSVLQGANFWNPVEVCACLQIN
jgi:hypothetical protein